jgi:hypothetical protein
LGLALGLLHLPTDLNRLLCHCLHPF